MTMLVYIVIFFVIIWLKVVNNSKNLGESGR
jgi:hypothetical protein